ncbi:hypothetical protein SAMN05421668_1122 [Halolactibacillus miurensis]|uniref:Uncharacterized protein n=1 Tax=Halolactibacillus miurensis TaxID=306541 RepID=A0A1I6T2Q1_9BACI|nr:hypothetical protein SAMN05421668_1122 [Halolactibacillus miurensis]
MKNNKQFLFSYHMFIYPIYAAGSCLMIYPVIPSFRLQEIILFPVLISYYLSPILFFIMLYENKKFYGRRTFSKSQLTQVIIAIAVYSSIIITPLFYN